MIDRCIGQHERLRLHVQPALDAREVSPAYRVFLRWLKGYLTNDKYEQVIQLLTFPLPTVDLTESIFNELSRALEGENGYTKFDFTVDNAGEDFNDYIIVKLKEEDFFLREGFETFKVAINNVLVVDLPVTQTGTLPDPYFYFLEPELLYDIDINYKGVIEYIVFNEANNPNIRYVFDDSFYRTYTRKEQTDIFTLQSEVRHSEYTADGERITGLGYCPARMFWDIPQTRPEIMQRKGPLTSKLGKLDKLLFWDVSTEYYESYGTYPIYWEYDNDESCDYEDGAGNHCEGGFIGGMAANGAVLDKRVCPKCARNNYVGPGSVKRIEPPVDNTDADLREPAGIIPVDVPALQNAQERLDARYEKLFISVVGKGGEPKNDQAKNQKQVETSLNSKENVLLTIKGAWERARKWGLDTVARLRYGDAFIGSTLIMGDEFYLVDEADLQEQYLAAKEKGAPAYVLAEMLKNLQQTKYRSNPEQIQRIDILAEVYPYPDHSVEELTLIDAQSPGLINPDLLLLKIGFNMYIRRFETEELDLVRFGIKLDFKNKIDLIKTKLLSYVTTDKTAASSWADSRRAQQIADKPSGPGNGNIGGQPKGNDNPRA